jgi:hypothetical protein
MSIPIRGGTHAVQVTLHKYRSDLGTARVLPETLDFTTSHNSVQFSSVQLIGFFFRKN